jgi:hypothetical protein
MFGAGSFASIAGAKPLFWLSLKRQPLVSERASGLVPQLAGSGLGTLLLQLVQEQLLFQVPPH